MSAALTRLFALGVLCTLALPGAAKPLSLEEVLSYADAPHPDYDVVLAQQEVARAEQMLAESLNDFRITLEAALRGGRASSNDEFSPDHVARLNARKTLWDAGRFDAGLEAARLESEARSLQTLDARAQRRLALMTRFFDVLLTDLQYAADNEYMAVAYVRWDNGRDRLQLGEMSVAELAELEARYQELRLRRNDVERRARERRALLAAAMNRPGELPAELVDPALKDNNRPLPEFNVLLAAMLERNPRLAMHKRLLAASTNRLAALRAETGPTLEFEAEAAAYSREASTRDNLRAGLNMVWPLHTGRRQDARLAREQAQFHALQAQYDKLALELRQALYETWQEIQFLRDVERRVTEVNAHSRDHALERARAEYELELKTNLGNSMADTQAARLRQRAVEYKLALAWERLAALLGGAPETIGTEVKK